jgi:hypothetical protein
MKKIMLVMILFVVSLSFAEEVATSLGDYEIIESDRAKKSGIAMISVGTAAIAGGAVLIYTGVNEKSGFIGALGGALAGVGLYLDVHSVFMFKKSKDILDEAKKREPLELGVQFTPNSLSLVGHF